MTAATATTRTTAASAINAAGKAVVRGAAATCGFLGGSAGINGARTSLTGD